MRMEGGFCMKARMPGTTASFGRMSAMISSTPMVRVLRGLRCMKMRPKLGPPNDDEELLPPPMLDMKVVTFGFACTMAASIFWLRCTSSKEAP